MATEGAQYEKLGQAGLRFVDVVAQTVGFMGPVFGSILLIALVLVSSTGCFKMGGDAEALRDSVISSSAAECDPEIEFGLGWLTMTIAHAALSHLAASAPALSPDFSSAKTCRHLQYMCSAMHLSKWAAAPLASRPASAPSP